MAALEQYLSGHAVIVSINAEMIWGQPTEETDSAGNLRSDHAVALVSIPKRHCSPRTTVVLARAEDEQILMETFVEAWATSHDHAVTTESRSNVDHHSGSHYRKTPGRLSTDRMFG